MSTGRLALFADCLLLGVMTAICAIPIVTAYPAFVAACVMLREDRSVTIRGYLGRLALVVRSGPVGLLAPPLAVGVVALDAVAVAAGVPGSGPLAVLLAVAALAGGVLALRAAARWRPAVTWSRIIRTAMRDLVADPGGSALLGVAALALLTIAFLVPLTLLLLGGMLALATVAVAARPHPADHPG